ncbi:Gamma-glutamyl phosphate reductase [Pseudomonas syringae pv. aptata]|uniref:Gamma-glutamyl phosphate reductase n=1 Tax=Pseudomonas syringae pv. aptata TaxID=83167 RepID=A0A3M3XGJ8_PSEAP|nr:Gamma-glutamyl phosphate reductase [Pseudomonas syringae pv. aptata]
MPVIKHLDGICHVYVSAHADLAKAQKIAFNAKTYRYGICGAMETLLVDQTIAADFLPSMAAQFREKGVELRGCERTRELIDVIPATEDDWHTEYLDAILSIRVVSGLDEAIEHINHYGSHHSDAIVSDHQSQVRRFMAEVDSSSVMVNAPTCFADGFEYGLGAEIGISTDKLHARGPVGLEGLTCEKYIVIGDGQLRGQA